MLRVLGFKLYSWGFRHRTVLRLLSDVSETRVVCLGWSMEAPCSWNMMVTRMDVVTVYIREKGFALSSVWGRGIVSSVAKVTNNGENHLAPARHGLSWTAGYLISYLVGDKADIRIFPYRTRKRSDLFAWGYSVVSASDAVATPLNGMIL